MEKEFIPYTLALALKELGFDEPCFGVYDYVEMLHFKKIYFFSDIKEPSYLAPLYQQAFSWFREKYDLCAYVVTAPNYIKGESKYKTRFSYEIYGMNEKSSSTVFITIRDVVNLSTHEEVELECLKKLIEIVKEK
jgi:hypothetical protein